MAGIVYLKTNRFEIKLEGITFKKKNFESLCKIDFLFPDGKDWDRPPIVGLDVMPHPRDPSIILLLLCFGTGCVILRFGAGESLPASIHRFLADKRICLVAFGVPEKTYLFPFQALGLRKSHVDIGYIAARVFKDDKYKRLELGELARKVLGIKRMVGLTEASSFERHAQIKCAICQLFVTNLIAMGLLGANDKKKVFDYSSKKSSFLKNLNSLHFLTDGLFKLTKKSKKKQQDRGDNIHASFDDDDDKLLVKEKTLMDYLADHSNNMANCGPDQEEEDDNDDDVYGDHGMDDSDSVDCFSYEKDKEGDSSDDSWKNASPRPIKGILKCPSRSLLRRCDSSSTKPVTSPSPSTPSSDQTDARAMLRRANSKGFNVSFKFQ